MNTGKLLLTSTGLSSENIAKRSQSFFTDPKNQSVAIVTTAAEGKEQNKYSQLAKKQFEEMGFTKIDFIDLPPFHGNFANSLRQWRDPLKLKFLLKGGGWGTGGPPGLQNLVKGRLLSLVGSIPTRLRQLCQNWHKNLCVTLCDKLSKKWWKGKRAPALQANLPFVTKLAPKKGRLPNAK